MSLMQILVFVVVGGMAGWIAGVVVRGGGQGILLNVLVGILGAFLGGWLFGVMGIGMAGLGGLFLMATIGAVILLALLRLISRR
ncbi:MAG: GlsB/YeaQ/YmgE family stress response membrane protein [Thioalkalivibrio sp.]|nr:GlsB/YeaQ/YmgE family stress response membrane protein [Thioalkalivibrio sp.]